MMPPERGNRGRRATHWKRISRLDAFYQDDAGAVVVGGLALASDGRIYFQYDTAWLERRIELSPHQLPLDVGTQIVAAPDPRRLHGLHGLFADSLPDRWGMRVLSLTLRRHGIDPEAAGPLDLLAFLGARAMGALSFRPASAFPDEAARAESLDELAEQALRVYEGTITVGDDRSARMIDALERAAGTAGGAQPKALVALSPDESRLLTGSAPPRGYTQYLVKFTPTRDGLGLRADSGVMEEAYARMARAAGVSFPRTRTLTTSDGRRHFAVERFDRTSDGGRRHVHTFGGLLGRDAADAGDYDELLRVVRALTGGAHWHEEILRRLHFNLAALNDDDHLKNTAFLLDPADGWAVAPAYDVTYSASRGGERGMSILGNEALVTWRDVDELAERHGVRRPLLRDIREQVEAAVSAWPEHAAASGVPGPSIDEVARAHAERRASLRRGA